MLEMHANPLITGIDHQSHADAQGGHYGLPRLLHRTFLRTSRTSRSRSRSSPTSSTRWSVRRSRSRAGAKNVYVKIPITNTRGETAAAVSSSGWRIAGVKVNVTAIMTLAQVRDVVHVLSRRRAALRFGFRRPHRRHRPRRAPAHDRGGRASEDRAGGRADLGEPARAATTSSRPTRPAVTSSPRRTDVLKKLSLVGYDLDAYSLDTVKMFYNDAAAAGFKL